MNGNICINEAAATNEKCCQFLLFVAITKQKKKRKNTIVQTILCVYTIDWAIGKKYEFRIFLLKCAN